MEVSSFAVGDEEDSGGLLRESEAVLSALEATELSVARQRK
jgi:hypothetical protein